VIEGPEVNILEMFTVNNKTHSMTKMSPLMTNYSRELRMEVNIRRKGKVEKITEFANRMKKVQKEARVVLRKAQEIK